jgi:hypothetical protein
VAASLSIGATTVVDCLQRAYAAGVAWPLPEDVTDENLEARLYPAATAITAMSARRPQPDWRAIHRELRRPGVTLQLLWEEHRAAHPDGYGYSRARGRAAESISTCPNSAANPSMMKAGRALSRGWRGAPWAPTQLLPRGRSPSPARLQPSASGLASGLVWLSPGKAVEPANRAFPAFALPAYRSRHPTPQKSRQELSRDGMLTRNIRTDGFVDPCTPIRSANPPSGPRGVHEIKHDGYRLIVRRDGIAVRLFTRNGYDWTARYPTIAAAALKLLAKSFTLDGEAVVCGPDGVAVFDALHRHGKVREAIPQAFDLLELNGEDFRPVAGLYQGEESGQPVHGAGSRRAVVIQSWMERIAGKCACPAALHKRGSTCGLQNQ